jgi:hypothetical protein
VDRARQLAKLGLGVAPGGAADQVGDLLPREPGETHSHDVVGAAQVGKRLRELLRHVGLGVAEGCDEQEARAPGGARQVAQEKKRRGVRPMPVLDHQQHRPLAADVREQVGNRRMEAMALRIGIGLDRRRQLADQGGQIRQQPGQLAAAGAKRGAQLRDLDDPQQVVERFDERPVRRPHHRVAGAVEDERAVGRGPAGELAYQTALPGARLAREQRYPATLAFDSRHQGPQLLQLCGAPDEG